MVMRFVEDKIGFGRSVLRKNLRTLHDEAFDSQQVRPFQSFETKIVECVVARMNNRCVEVSSVGHDDAVSLLADGIRLRRRRY